jgi:hypothetical protein
MKTSIVIKNHNVGGYLVFKENQFSFTKLAELSKHFKDIGGARIFLDNNKDTLISLGYKDFSFIEVHTLEPRGS